MNGLIRKREKTFTNESTRQTKPVSRLNAHSHSHWLCLS